MIKINHNNNIYQSKLKDFIILLISLFLIQTIFHILCFNEFELIGIYFFIYRVHINHFIISTIFAFLIFIKRGRITAQILIIILTLFFYSNLLYFRAFGEFIPLHDYLLISNLHGFEFSLTTLISYFDILLCLPIILCYFGLHRNINSIYNITVKTKSMSIVALFMFLTSPFILYSKDTFVEQYRNFISVYNYGLIPITTVNIYKEITKNNDITYNERKTIETYIEGKENKTKKNDKIINKNIIIILVESLESWVLQKNISNNEITPYLNAILKKDTAIVYLPKVLTQVNGGRSSDAQLIINTGILPIKNGATCYRYTHNYFPNLGSELKAKNHFKKTITMMGYSSDTWNQKEFNISLGFDSLIHIKNYKNDLMICEGLNDKSFLQQSIEKLKELQQPYYAQLITLSSHAPFKIPQSLKSFYTKNYNTTFLDYINSIHYVDNAIGSFIEQLKKENIYNNSIIIITGDHNTGVPTKLSTWQEMYSDICGEKSYIPFIIINSGKSLFINQEVDQIDLFPSIIDLLNINSDWKGLGESILSESYNTKKMERKAYFNANNNIWNVSDLIITKNYFKNTKSN